MSVLAAILAVVIISDFGATSAGTKPYDPSLMASWMQAIGSVAAILGALWIASEQSRREIARRAEESKQADYVLQAELAWLSSDIVLFLEQFSNVEAGARSGYVIADDDLASLLDRLSWCRQRVKHKGQLAMIGLLHTALITIVRIVRARIARPSTVFDKSEATKIRLLRIEVETVAKVASGDEYDPRYSS
ncbi:hypothetical protein F3J18_06735 [Burkholderia sp. Ax-1720]|nr:hypothetical protein [Burkholderia sp. Ax-1720]NIF94950.1 hypothetical protein [Burkholderia sp. Ax-1720]